MFVCIYVTGVAFIIPYRGKLWKREMLANLVNQP